MGFGGQARRRK